MKTKNISLAFAASLLASIAVFHEKTVKGQGRLVLDAHVDLQEKKVETVGAGGVEEGTVRGRVRDSGAAKWSRAKRVQVAGYNSKLVPAVYRECAHYHIDPVLVFSLIWQESGGKLHVISAKGAAGPMQLMPGTAAQYGARNPFDPDQAVKAGVAYLITLLDQFGGNVSQALAAYNAGSVPVDAFLRGKRVVLRNGKVVNPRSIRTVGGIPPYRETQNYVESIANYYRSLRREAGTRAGLSQSSY